MVLQCMTPISTQQLFCMMSTHNSKCGWPLGSECSKHIVTISLWDRVHRAWNCGITIACMDDSTESFLGCSWSPCTLCMVTLHQASAHAYHLVPWPAAKLPVYGYYVKAWLVCSFVSVPQTTPGSHVGTVRYLHRCKCLPKLHGTMCFQHCRTSTHVSQWVMTVVGMCFATGTMSALCHFVSCGCFSKR